MDDLQNFKMIVIGISECLCLDRGKNLACWKKFWVGWAERAPEGNRTTIHSDMQLRPHHHPIDAPVNLVYQIPMDTVYGNGIPILLRLLRHST
jgi:hypothetical protein